MAVVAGVVFFCGAALLALLPALTVGYRMFTTGARTAQRAFGLGYERPRLTPK
jgi:hypothetical protein